MSKKHASSSNNYSTLLTPNAIALLSKLYFIKIVCFRLTNIPGSAHAQTMETTLLKTLYSYPISSITLTKMTE